MLTKDKSFYRTFVGLALALMMQQAVVLSVNLADNVMLGSYSETALSGVAAVNQIQFILQQLVFGFSNGMIVLASQYWGKRQIEPIRRLMALAFAGAMGVAALLRQTLAKAKKYAEDIETAKAEGKPAPFDFQMEAMLPVIRKEIPLKAHAHRADDILTVLRVCKEFDVDVTLDHVTEGHLIVDKLVDAGKPVLVGPSLGSKSKFELKEKSFATPGILNKAGLEVCIITDAPVIPLNYLPLCAGLAVREGLDEDAAWRAITINPAKGAGIADRVGSLEVGKDADIAVFDSDPLKSIQARAKQVFVNGQPVL